MTEGDGAAERVERPGNINAELTADGQNLRRERLVYLDHVEVGDRHRQPLQQASGGLDRAEAHGFGCQSGDMAAEHPGAWLNAQLSGPGSGHHQGRGRSVVHRARVARRDASALALHWRQRGQLRQGRSRARTVVTLDDGAADRYRQDFPGERPVVAGGHRPALREHGELVHVLARDPVLGRDPLRRLVYGDVHIVDEVRAAAVGQPRVEIAGLERAAAAGDALDARHDERVALAGLDGVMRHAQGLERGRAEPVHRRARHGVGQPGQLADDAPEVIRLLAGRRRHAADDVVHASPGYLGMAPEQLVDDERGHVVGPHIHQAALVGAPDRRAQRVDDNSLGHDDVLACPALMLVRACSTTPGSLRRTTLPDAVRGISSTNATDDSRLYADIRSATKAWNSSGVAAEPARRTIATAGRWPAFSSGTG